MKKSKQKHYTRVQMARTWIFLRPSFGIIFQKIQHQNVTGNGIFPVQKTLQKMMKITRFELLRAPFVDRDQVCRREAKIMQNDAKMQLKSSQNDHEKTWIPILQ